MWWTRAQFFSPASTNILWTFRTLLVSSVSIHYHAFDICSSTIRRFDRVPSPQRMFPVKSNWNWFKQAWSQNGVFGDCCWVHQKQTANPTSPFWGDVQANTHVDAGATSRVSSILPSLLATRQASYSKRSLVRRFFHSFIFLLSAEWQVVTRAVLNQIHLVYIIHRR
jgi:hypothetical protein